MKLRIEISDVSEEEVVIRCRERTDITDKLVAAFSDISRLDTTLALTSEEKEHFVPVRQILFFESARKKVAAHTQEKCYFTDKRLYELEKILGRTFVRVSKYCIVNSEKVSSISKGVTGSGEAFFDGTDKSAYISRAYYAVLKQIIYETRIKT